MADQIMIPAMQYRDLFALRPCTPVIQLEKHREASEVVETFVFTGEVRRALTELLSRISSGEGGGAMIRGHYGSGKSHLLAFIAVECDNWTRSKSVFRHRPLPAMAPIRVSLVSWDARIRLWDIVCSSLQAEGYTLLSFAGSRAESLMSVQREVQAKGLRGLIFLIDELSEYLKSVNNVQDLNEDLRTLQFLAEFCQAQGGWCLASLQEELDGLDLVSRDMSLKIKDRFPHRWVLGHRHLGHLLGQRLLEYRPDARQHVERSYRDHLAKWKDAELSFERYANIFPMHPRTFELLEGLGKLFSRHRGALDFFKSVLLGENHAGPAFLDEPVGRHIGADRLFDFFRERMREADHLRDYVQLAYVHIESRCHQVLKAEDGELALRCVKILIMASLDVRRQGCTVEELVEMLEWTLGDSPVSARNYLDEKILQPLRERADFIGLRRERYSIDLKEQTSEWMEKCISRSRQGLSLEHPRVQAALFAWMDRMPLDFKNLTLQPEIQLGITWLNSRRSLRAAFAPEEGVELVIWPMDHQPGLATDDRLHWVPRGVQEGERETLLRMVALEDWVSKEPQSSLDIQARQRGELILKRERPVLRNILEQLYFEGTWYLKAQKMSMPADWTHLNHLEKMVEEGAYEFFRSRFPRFHEVSPRLEYYNERMITDMIEGWVVPGSCSTAELGQGGLLDMVRGLAKPMGLVQQQKSRLVFSWNTQTSSLLQYFMEALEQGEGEVLFLREKLMGAPYGLTRILTDTLLWISVMAGICRAWRGGELLETSKLSFQNLHTLERLEAHGQIEAQDLERLRGQSFFEAVDTDLAGMALQNELWRVMCLRMSTALRWLETMGTLSLHRGWDFLGQAHERDREILLKFCSGLELEQKASQAGLKSLLDHFEELDLVRQAWLRLQDMVKLVPRCHQNLMQTWIYLQARDYETIPRIGVWREMLGEREELMDEWSRWHCEHPPIDEVEPWLQRAEQWVRHYRICYIEAAQEFQNQLKVPREVWDWAFSTGMDLRGCEDWRSFSGLLCNRDHALELAGKPYCRCGFIPGNDHSDILEDLGHEALLDWLRQRFGSNGKWLLLVESVRSGDWEGASKLYKEISARPPQKRRIPLGQLQQRWKGRTWTRAKLLEDFSCWLDEQEGDQFEVSE